MNEGLELMAAGMGVVFFFLALMVCVMLGMAVILKRFAKPENQTSGGGASGGSRSDELAEVAVAIAAITARFRS